MITRTSSTASASPSRKYYRTPEGVTAVVFFLIAIISFAVHFAFFRHSFPVNNIDEATFLSPAYNLAVHGTFSTDIHASFLPGADTYTYWMPPLYMFLLGGVLKIFGVSILNAKLFSYLLTLCSAFLLSLLTKDRYVRTILVSLFLICPFIIIISARIRMEALAIVLICLSILAVKRQWPVHLTGALAGLAALTHPMALPCCAAMAFFSLRRGFRPLMIFSMAALVVILPYVFYVLEDFALFKEQMNIQYARKAAATLNKLKLEYILQFVPTSLAALVFLFLCKREREFRIFLSISLILTVILILRSNEFNYQVYTIPYLIAAIGLFLEERSEILYRRAVPAFFFIFFVGMLILKADKNNNFQRDNIYYQLTGYLNKHKNWSGKTIYVTGPYDLSTYLMVKHQKVERVNVVNKASPGWHEKFNYVIAIVEKKGPKKSQKKGYEFWKHWEHQKAFTTSDGRYTLYTATTNGDTAVKSTVE
jgi:hypothetical protein